MLRSTTRVLPPGSQFIFFVVDINGTLSPQTKAYLDGFQTELKDKGHPNFAKFLIRNISLALARQRASTIKQYEDSVSRQSRR